MQWISQTVWFCENLQEKRDFTFDFSPGLAIEKAFHRSLGIKYSLQMRVFNAHKSKRKEEHLVKTKPELEEVIFLSAMIWNKTTAPYLTHDPEIHLPNKKSL